MRFNRKVNWKCVQVYDWTKSVHLTIVTWDLTKRWTENVSKYKIVQKSVYLTIVTWDLKRLQCTWIWYLYEICKLNMVTSDLTKSWTENVSKYMIELKSVYLAIVRWDLTERWTENVSKYMIELKSVHLTIATWDLTTW